MIFKKAYNNCDCTRRVIWYGKLMAVLRGSHASMAKFCQLLLNADDTRRRTEVTPGMKIDGSLIRPDFSRVFY